MTFPKRTFEKPIPISPLIALDRERCILCYRCTRFSEDVAEDGQLVAVNRGAQSMIATFEDEPYRGHFSGNVTEICPVGALTSTQYRFAARPWEIQNVPTVCGLCPVGCNISATTREGKVKRIQSRNHPEIDEGWLCDKGRFAFGHLHADDRDLRAAARRPGRAASSKLSWDDALDEAERLLRAGGCEHGHRASRAARRSSRPTRSASCSAQGLGADTRRAAGGRPRLARRLARAALGAARREDDRRAQRRPRRRARADRRALAQGRTPGRRHDQLRAARPGRSTRSSSTTPPRRAGVDGQGRLLPAADAERPRRHRRLERRGRRRADRRAAAPADHLGDEAAADPAVRAMAAERRRGDRDRPVRGELPGPGRPRPAGHELPRARRHDRQPRGPPAAPAPRGARSVPRRARLDLRRSPSASASRSPRTRHWSSTRSRQRASAASRFGDVGEHSELPRPGRRAAPAPPSPRRAAGAPRTGCASSPTGRSSPAPPSSARRSCSSSAPPPRSSCSRPTPARAASATARRSRSPRTARRSSCEPASRATSPPAPSASPQEHAADLHAVVEVRRRR